MHSIAVSRRYTGTVVAAHVERRRMITGMQHDQREWDLLQGRQNRGAAWGAAPDTWLKRLMAGK